MRIEKDNKSCGIVLRCVEEKEEWLEMKWRRKRRYGYIILVLFRIRKM